MFSTDMDPHINQELWITCVGCTRTIVVSFEPSFMPSRKSDDNDSPIGWPWLTKSGERLDCAFVRTTCRACRLDIFNFDEGVDGTENLMIPDGRNISRIRRMEDELKSVFYHREKHTKLHILHRFSSDDYSSQVQIRDMMNHLLGISKEGSVTLRYLLLDKFRNNRSRGEYADSDEFLTYKIPGDFM